jgi:hypothetical protein
MSGIKPLFIILNIIRIGRIELKNADTAKKSNDEGGCSRKIRIVKAYKETRGALKIEDKVIAIFCCSYIAFSSLNNYEYLVEGNFFISSVIYSILQEHIGQQRLSSMRAIS